MGYIIYNVATSDLTGEFVEVRVFETLTGWSTKPLSLPSGNVLTLTIF